MARRYCVSLWQSVCRSERSFKRSANKDRGKQRPPCRSRPEAHNAMSNSIAAQVPCGARSASARGQAELWKKQWRGGGCTSGGQLTEDKTECGLGCPRQGSRPGRGMQSAQCRNEGSCTMHCERNAVPREVARKEDGWRKSGGSRLQGPPGQACPACVREVGVPAEFCHGEVHLALATDEAHHEDAMPVQQAHRHNPSAEANIELRMRVKLLRRCHGRPKTLQATAAQTLPISAASDAESCKSHSACTAALVSEW